MHGKVSYFVFVSLCVSWQNISKNIEPINFIFGGSLSSNSGKKPFDFEQNCPGVMGGWEEGGEFGPRMIRDRRKNFRVAMTPKRCVLDM